MDSQKEAAIQATLARIEAEHGVSILYACESGSRAWDFASQQSDYDVRFLYVRPQSAYLSLDIPRDVIELPIHDDLDVNGWDIMKALHLLRKSNPPLLEWLLSPIVYKETPLIESLRVMAQQHFSPRSLRAHYWHMAEGNFKQYLQGRSEVLLKKYLYVLRPLVALLSLEQHQMLPPTSFVQTLAGVNLPGKVREHILTLIEQKRAGDELGTGTSNPVLHFFIEMELEGLNHMDYDLSNVGEKRLALARACEEWLSKLWESRRSTPTVEVGSVREVQ